jgi:hypothetical protein
LVIAVDPPDNRQLLGMILRRTPNVTSGRKGLSGRNNLSGILEELLETKLSDEFRWKNGGLMYTPKMYRCDGGAGGEGEERIFFAIASSRGVAGFSTTY